jgi:hypothetical protein
MNRIYVWTEHWRNDTDRGTQVLTEKFILVLLCPPQILHVLKLWLENLEGRNQLEDLGLYVRIIQNKSKEQ